MGEGYTKKTLLGKAGESWLCLIVCVAQYTFCDIAILIKPWFIQSLLLTLSPALLFYRQNQTTHTL